MGPFLDEKAKMEMGEKPAISWDPGAENHEVADEGV